MHSILKNLERRRTLCVALIAMLCALVRPCLAAEEYGHLTIVPDDGIIMLDFDTLRVVGTVTLDVAPGEHVLSFFPSQADMLWAHRYVDYGFTIGAAGRRTFDLTRREVFSFRSDPQSADIEYRGKVIGHTPGDYLLLLGMGDSISLKLPGYQRKSLDIDRAAAAGNEIFAALETLGPSEYFGEIEPATYTSPIKPLLEPEFLLSLGAGAALLAAGVHFNQRADNYYNQYIHLAGRDAIEQAYQDALRNDRLSKAAFLAGDLSIGAFGYFLIRKIIVGRTSGSGIDRHRPLSFKITARSAALTLKF